MWTYLKCQGGTIAKWTNSRSKISSERVYRGEILEKNGIPTAQLLQQLQTFVLSIATFEMSRWTGKKQKTFALLRNIMTSIWGERDFNRFGISTATKQKMFTLLPYSMTENAEAVAMIVARKEFTKTGFEISPAYKTMRPFSACEHIWNVKGDNHEMDKFTFQNIIREGI